MVSPFLLRAVLDDAIPAQRHPAARRAGRRDDRDRGRHRRARRRADAALEHRRPARDARPARRRLPPPPAPLPGVLHADPHRGGAVADRQRHRRRADGRHEHRDLDRLERDDGAGRDGRDVPARLAARGGRARPAAVLRMAHPPRGPGAAADHGRAPGPARRHVVAGRGVAVGLRDPARQDDGPLAASLRSASRASPPRWRTSRSAPGWRGAGGWRRCRSALRPCRR